MNLADIELSVAVAQGVAQQAALDEWLRLHPAGKRAVLSEGLFADLSVPADVALRRLAPGCVCCAGFVPLRVNLMRLLREQSPRAVLLLLASGEHYAKVEDMLSTQFPGLRLAGRAAASSHASSSS